MYRFLFSFITVFFIFNSLSCTASSKTSLISSEDIQTAPEEIGLYLSELLIQRGDIRATSLTFTFDELLGDNSLEDFEDSPAMLILTMLTNQQRFTQKAWDNLLFQADKFSIKKKAIPVKTYFMQTGGVRFLLICILSSSDKYYCFTANMDRKDEDNWYVSNVSKDIKKYNTLSQLEEEWLNMDKLNDYILNSDLQDEDIERLIGVKTYSYNSSPVLPELKQPELPSLEPIIAGLSQGLTAGYITLPFFPDNPTIKKEWTEVINSFKEKQIDSIYSDVRLTNIPLYNTSSYNARINYSITCEENEYEYEFCCDVFLEKEEWNILSISPVYKYEKIEWINF